MLEQHTARRENAVPNVIVNTQLHRQRLFLPDDLRHLYKQQPKPLVHLCQLRVFRFQLVLLPDQLRNVCGSDLRIVDARFCCDLLLRKAQRLPIRKSVNPKARVQTANVCGRRVKSVPHLCKGLYAAFSQPVCNGKHSAVDEPHHAVFIEEADCDGQIVEAFLNPVHTPLPPRSFRLPRHILQSVLILLPFQTRKPRVQPAERLRR